MQRELLLDKKKRASFREKQNKTPHFSYSFGNSDILSFSNIKSGQLEAKHFEFLQPGTLMAEHVLSGTAKTPESCLGLQGKCHFVHLSHRRTVEIISVLLQAWASLSVVEGREHACKSGAPLI